MNATEGTRPASVPPPIPAPYLEGVPRLPAELLKRLKSSRHRMTAGEARSVLRKLRALKERIFAARSAYEEAAGVRIRPEPTAYIRPE